MNVYVANCSKNVNAIQHYRAVHNQYDIIISLKIYYESKKIICKKNVTNFIYPNKYMG